MSEIDNAQIGRSIETDKRLDGIVLKDDSPILETPQEFSFVQDLPKTKILNNFKKAECSRFVINLYNNKYLFKNNSTYI